PRDDRPRDGFRDRDRDGRDRDSRDRDDRGRDRSDAGFRDRDDRPRGTFRDRDDRPRGERRADDLADDRGGRPSAVDGPSIPDDVTADQLDPAVRRELGTLARPVADQVARRLVMAGRLVDEDPEQALQHAIAARRLASRLGVVREAVGIAAYHAGEWQTALSEIRTYHRLTGRQTHLAILASCERPLGRPQNAIQLVCAGGTPTA